jgi:hypothetical protein
MKRQARKCQKIKIKKFGQIPKMILAKTNSKKFKGFLFFVPTFSE